MCERANQPFIEYMKANNIFGTLLGAHFFGFYDSWQTQRGHVWLSDVARME